MNNPIKDAVEFLINSHGDIRAQAVSYAQVIPKQQVEDALKAADVNTAEAVVLAILLNAYPTTVITYKGKKADADSPKE